MENNAERKEYTPVGIHVNSKNQPCSGAREGEPYTQDQCLVCWVAKNVPQYSFLNENLDKQPQLSELYLKNMEARKEVVKVIQQMQKEKDDIPIWKKAVNFAKSAGKWLASGAKFVPDEVKAKRLFICQHCSQFTKQGTCSHVSCGCQMNSKVSMASEKCPVNKWLPYEDIPRFDESTKIDQWIEELKKPREYVHFRKYGEYYAAMPSCTLAHEKLLFEKLEEVKESLKNSSHLPYEKYKTTLVLCHPEDTRKQNAYFDALQKIKEANLPYTVEYWYIGEHFLDPEVIKVLETFKVKFCDALNYINRNKRRVLEHKHLKYFAMLHSSGQYVVYFSPDFVPTSKLHDFLLSTELYEYPLLIGPKKTHELEINHCSSFPTICANGAGNGNLHTSFTDIFILDKNYKNVWLLLNLLDEICNHNDFYKFEINSILIQKLMNMLEFTEHSSNYNCIYLLESNESDNSIKDKYGRPLFVKKDAGDNKLLLLGDVRALMTKNVFLNALIKNKYSGVFILQNNDLYMLDTSSPNTYQRMIKLYPDGTVVDDVNLPLRITRWGLKLDNNPHSQKHSILLFTTVADDEERLYAMLNEEVPNLFVGQYLLENQLPSRTISLERINK